MDAKTLLLEEIEREYKYLRSKDVGTEEYNASMSRLNTLVEKLAEIEHFEDDKKDRLVKNIFDGVKFALGSIIIPVCMSLLILKYEETGSLTTAVKSWATGTATRKMF